MKIGEAASVKLMSSRRAEASAYATVACDGVMRQ